MEEDDDFVKKCEQEDREDRAAQKAFYEKEIEKAKKGSAADRDFFNAAHMARKSTEENGLLPMNYKDGEYLFTIQQGLKGAVWSREDSAATLFVQRAILQRLDQHRLLLWVVIAILAYIAFRIS